MNSLRNFVADVFGRHSDGKTEQQKTEELVREMLSGADPHAATHRYFAPAKPQKAVVNFGSQRYLEALAQVEKLKSVRDSLVAEADALREIVSTPQPGEPFSVFKARIVDSVARLAWIESDELAGVDAELVKAKSALGLAKASEAEVRAEAYDALIAEADKASLVHLIAAIEARQLGKELRDDQYAWLNEVNIGEGLIGGHTKKRERTKDLMTGLFPPDVLHSVWQMRSESGLTRFWAIVTKRCAPLLDAIRADADKDKGHGPEAAE